MSVIVNKAKEQIIEAVKKAAESAMTSGALERAELCDFAIEIPSNRDHGDYEAALDAAASWGLPISDKRKICSSIAEIEDFINYWEVEE